MNNKEIFKLFRESSEANFMVFLENNVQWVEVERPTTNDEGESNEA